jgi:hypothetical protein
MMFFSLLGFILLLSILFWGIRLMFGALDSMSWFSYFYMIGMLLLPSSFFIFVYVVFFKRTRSHPSKPVRLISNLLFTVAISTWLVVLVADMISFFKMASKEISNYFSYNLLFLTINIATIFLIGVIQALTAEKEKDWMDKYV